MKRRTFVGAAAALLAAFLFAVVCFVSTSSSLSTPPGVAQAGNNPQEFYLWSTDSSFSYTFICDPRAADLWLLRSCGGTMFVLRPPAGSSLLLLTNRFGW
jgi:hypothetical protein